MTLDSQDRLGFQRSETTGCEIKVYAHGRDPLFRASQGVLVFDGRGNERDTGPSVVSWQTSKAMGGGAGTWSCTVKVPQALDAEYDQLRKRVTDDCWIDIVATKHARKVHVMRGLVSSVRETYMTGQATARTYTLTGRDFGVVFEKTPIWYNVLNREDVEVDAIKIFQRDRLAGSVDRVVGGLLFGFLTVLGTRKRATWVLPKGMPATERRFVDEVLWDYDQFTNSPERATPGAQPLQINGQMLWAIAKEFSDPAFCELYCDLFPKDRTKAFDPATQYDVTDTRMGVRLRDRPFLTVNDTHKSPWFKIPMTEVTPQDIVMRDIGAGGEDRYNMVAVSPQLLQETNEDQFLRQPLWDRADIEVHGLRQFLVESRYAPTAKEGMVAGTRTMQNRIRDWHCMNQYLLNGTVTLATLRPHIRIGTRLRILGSAPEKNETYYVENVSHAWSAGTAGRTTLTVSRGWEGTDAQYTAALTQIAARFELLQKESLISIENLPGSPDTALA